MSKFNADSLQEMFVRIDRNETTKEAAANFYDKSVGSLNNYFQARKAYEKGREVCAQNVSTKAFTAWAVKYGGKGEPVYKRDPHPERRHVKKCEQVRVEDICELEKNDIPQMPIAEIPAIGCDRITELSAADKKELAMYAIDQHYFFLKQLTGVI